MNKINISKSIQKSVNATTKKVEIVNNGKNIIINENGKLKMFGIYNISPQGILCDDLETLVKLEDL